MNSTTNSTTTNWRAIWVLYLAGCTLALHIGKLPAALPLLIEEFEMSLAQTGNLVSIYAVLIAAGGLLCGMFARRFGYVRFAAIGVGLCVLSSFAGVYSHSLTLLMLTRAIEGLGWIMGVVAIPVIMSTLCNDKDRPVVMGLWGAFMAVGAGSMLLLAPQLQIIGSWRLSWMVAAFLSGVGTAAILLVCYRNRERLSPLNAVRSNPVQAGDYQSELTPRQALRNQFKSDTKDLRKRGSVAVFVCFLCYSFQYMCVTSFLPTLLVEDSGMSLPLASFWTAVVLIPNAIGNISAGWLINWGLKRSTILAGAALLMGICALVALATTDSTLRVMAALAMTGIGGIIPGTLFSTAALLASSAAVTGMIIGFMLSGAGLGQLFGPVFLTRAVESSGHWYTGGVLCLVVALIGAYFARWLSDLPAVSR